MKAIVTNKLILLSNPTKIVKSSLQKILSFKDKSKQFQLNRMKRNPFHKGSNHLKQLEKDIYGKAYKELPNGDMVFSSSLLHYIKDIDIEDRRCLTGATVPMPWKTKPFNPRPYQEESIQLMENNYRGIINLATGCHAKNEKILMHDGFTKLSQDIVIGDKLMGPDGKPRKVLKLVNGQDDMYEIIPNKGDSFTVNGEHILSLQRSYSSLYRSKKYKQKKSNIDSIIDNISVVDYLKKTTSYKHKYKLYRSECIEFKEKELFIPPYILGLWLGDGCKINPKITTMDTEIENEIYVFAKNNNYDVVVSNTDKKAKDFRINGGFISKIRQLGLYNNKHIPHIYKTASKKQRLELLAGLLDTDGSLIDGTVFDIVQKKEKIADAIVYIARSLGFASYKKETFKVATNSKNKKKNKYFRVSITGHTNIIPTRLPRKKAKNREQIKNVLRTGFKIEKLNRDNYYGFTVSDDNLYLIGDFTVTHNCGKTLVAIHCIKRHRTKTLVIVPSDSIARQFLSDAQEAFGDNMVAMYGGGKKKTANITIAIAASVVKNPEVFTKLDLGLVIYDEVHHIAANTFFKISKNLGDIGKVFGLTATDYRGDGKDILIEAGCGETLIRRDIVWGVKNKWLAKPIFIIKEIDTNGTDFNDKLKSYKEHVLNNNDTKKMIYNDIKNAIKNNKSTLCLVAEVEHGEELSNQLGIPFAQGSDKKSQEYVNQLNNKKIDGLIGTTGKVGEGTDTKNVEILVMANFMAGKGIVIQSLGRGLRLVDGKTECIIYDYIPTGSSILKRHALGRIKYYREITDDITIIKADNPMLRL